MTKRELKHEIDKSIKNNKNTQESNLNANDRMAALNDIYASSIKGYDNILDNISLLHSINEGQRANFLSSLQRTHGNAYVQRLLIQAKLTVNPPDDQYEHEADRIGNAVAQEVAGPMQRQEEETVQGKTIQRQPEDEELLQGKTIQRQPEDEELLQGKTVQRQPEDEELLQGKTVQRQPEDEELLQGKTVQRQPEDEELLQGKTVQRQPPEEEEMMQLKTSVNLVPEVVDSLEERIKKARGGGEELPNTIRASFEPHFGRDFSQVSVHSDLEANDLSQNLGARAFTTGSDIFFRSGDYSPDTEDGRKLIGHELTHVVQQGGASLSRKDIETEEKEGFLKKIEAITELEKGKARALRNMSQVNLKALLYQAANCQQLGADSEGAAKNALDQTLNEVMAILKEKTNALNVKTSSLKMARDLLNQLAMVQLVMTAGGSKDVQVNYDKVLNWAQEQLTNALRALESDPAELKVKEVLEKAAIFQILGGNPETAIAAIQNWRQVESM
ncbi:DUF4157 domain-containing protein [Chloroflexota bacterium]